MKYLEAIFTFAGDASLFGVARDLVAAAAGEAGFESFEEMDGGLRGYVQDQLFSQSMLDEGLADLGLEGVSVSYEMADAEDKDWNEEWERTGFDPIDVDSRIIIFDAGRGVQTAPAGVQPAYIRARQAFGTGTHQTTRMMLSMLMERLLPSVRVLDCGCGTGILGITAALLGAGEVVSYDIDEWSVDNTRHNARLNGVGNIDVRLGDAKVLTQIEGDFDIIMANINRNILLADLPAFAGKLSEAGTLLLSGFYASDAPLILDKAATLGLYETGRKTEDDWCCLALNTKQFNHP